MSARKGGEADKFGARYEDAWTVHHLLLVLAGRAEAITVEDDSEIAEGAEFTLVRDAATELHQVKRRNGSAKGWTPRALNNKNVLGAARYHVDRGRQFHFVSMIPAIELDTLSDRARRSGDVQSFLSEDNNWMTKDLRPHFDYLVTTDVAASDQGAWQLLRGMWMHCQDESGLRSTNDALAEFLLDGATPRLAVLALGELVQDHLGVRLDAARVAGLLRRYKVRLAHRVGSPALIASVAATLDSWKAGVERELLDPIITRAESTELAETIRSSSRQVVIAVGTAGAGKSAVLHQAALALETEDWAILAFRLDRLGGVASTADIGHRLGLGISPVAAVAAAAADRRSLLVIDQLDAVSWASGRMPDSFDAVDDLIREAAAFPQMRVLLACRAFDVDNDHRIRRLVSDDRVARVDVTQLLDSQVDASVMAMGLSTSQLTAGQRSLLRLPLNLVLLSVIADQADALSFTSATGLLNAYWERKQRRCSAGRQLPVRFARVIDALADAMSSRQQLRAPVSVLDEDGLEPDAEVLASEHVLVRDGQWYAFFHEAFFDYAFSRRWVNRGQDLVTFLLADEQELFRRAQVRQILQRLRDDDPDRFVGEVDAVLSHPGIRFHIKVVVLALLRSLPDPSAGEWEMVDRQLNTEGPVGKQLWMTISTLPWFDRLDAAGAMDRWLASGDRETQHRALEVMPGAVKERPDRLAALLAPYAGNTDQYPQWLLWITRFADLHNSRALFDLILEAVRRGDVNGLDRALWMNTLGLGQRQPEWAVELVAAWLAERPGAWDRDPLGKVVALGTREDSVTDLVSDASRGAPLAYCRRLIPYLRQVMSLTETDPATQPVADQHFTHRQRHLGVTPGLDDALLHGAANALRSSVGQHPDALQPLLDELARDPHDGAQWLLYEALRSDGARYAERAAELLLEGEHRLHSGYLDNSHWTTRELLEATTPHLSTERFRDLETTMMALRPSWEQFRSVGYTAFKLLSAMDEQRLSDSAKRRLGELRRKFNTDQPAPPTDITASIIRSPIPTDAAQHMSDDHWLRAMTKHTTDTTDHTSLTGGVHQLSQLLREQATNDPTRFARLAVRLTHEIPPSYANAILEALGQTSEPVEPTLVFDAMRHIAGLRHSENNRSVIWALHKQLDDDVPDDIIELILDRALHASHPTEEAWATQAPGGKYYYNGDILSSGINSDRGQAADTLGSLLAHDTDGHRTALVAPLFTRLAQDPSVSVRSCVAHVLTAGLRYATDEALAAYEHLIDTDDRLLATAYCMQLTLSIGTGKPEAVEPVIRRMLASSHESVRRTGGYLAAYAGLEHGLQQLFTTAQESPDPSIRTGTAELCAQRLPYVPDRAAATEALRQFVTDENDEVRKGAAQVVATLRNHALQPFRHVLTSLITAETFTQALSQLLITLQAAPDQVDDLVIAATRRFIDVYGDTAGDISTSAAATAPKMTQLILRAYAQAPSRDTRRQVLDLIDELLVINARGALEAVDAAEH